MKLPRVIPAGDAAAMVLFAEEMSAEVIDRVQALGRAINAARPPGVRDVMAVYNSVLVHYDPLALSLEEIEGLVERLASRSLDIARPEGRERALPTVYGGAYGPDLAYVAQRLQMPEQEVVRLHEGATFLVCTLGFAPGQPYVVGLPPQLRLPRRESPRERVPAGSVLIAAQTVVYPLPNPTGWWLIGRTPIKLFDPSADPPTYLQPGDRVRFPAIPEEEYLELGGEPEG